MSYFVEVVRADNMEVERRIGPYDTPQQAEKVESAVYWNMDRERVFTHVVERETLQ